MQEEQLIAKLKELKNISPSKEWAVLAKIKILETQKSAEISTGKHRIMTMTQSLLAVIFQKKYAYAFAVLAILLVGSVGLMQLPRHPVVPAASPAALVEVKNGVEAFKVKSKELSMVDQKDPKEFSAAVNSIKIAAKQLTEAIQKDPGVAKEIALEINNNKTYLNVEGSVEGSAELKSTLDEMYKNTVKPVIEDLNENRNNLTESQRKSLDIAIDLYKKERYTDALESVLLLNAAIEGN